MLEWTLARCCEVYNAGATSTYLLTLSEATHKRNETARMNGDDVGQASAF
jgi:hypothetical protein